MVNSEKTWTGLIAIEAENIEMVKFVAPKIKKHEFPVDDYIKLAERSGNIEILEYLNSLVTKRSNIDGVIGIKNHKKCI